MVSKFIAKRIVFPILSRFSKIYFSKPRTYNYQSVRGIVNSGVFFPHFTISTRLLLDFLSSKKLSGKTFLELGSGTGIISAFAASKGAVVTASDINPAAVANTIENAKKNGVAVKAIQSDLFDAFSKEPFDYIIINPPYYPKDPTSDAEKAWYCGAEFQYFDKLFSTLSPFVNPNSLVYMILSDDCELDQIQSIAKTFGFKFSEVFKTKKWKEWNFIFRISLIDSKF